jgi:hypothetical protein
VVKTKREMLERELNIIAKKIRHVERHYGKGAW